MQENKFNLSAPKLRRQYSAIRSSRPKIFTSVNWILGGAHGHQERKLHNFKITTQALAGLFSHFCLKPPALIRAYMLSRVFILNGSSG